ARPPCAYRPAIAATNSSRAAMLIRLILSPADEHRSGANQMRQHLSFREHFRRGNAFSHPDRRATIDDLDLLPAQSTHPFGHRILQLLTFLILSYLSFAGLPKVDDRLPSQMLRFDLGTVQNFGHWLFPPPRERPLPERGP